jgi:hypothetical protein
LEALHEPIFGFVSFAAYPAVWLEDVKEHQRYTPVADEIPELQRYFYTGRFRASGEWCGLAHLDPLVLRVRLDTHDGSRQRMEMVFTSVLKRLDVLSVRYLAIPGAAGVDTGGGTGATRGARAAASRPGQGGRAVRRVGGPGNGPR